MKLIEFIVRRKIFVALLFLFIIITGIFATGQLDKKLFPTYLEDGVAVELAASNLNALEFEQEIVNPLEQRFKSIEGYESMDATISSGGASINVYFDKGKGEDGLRELQSVISSLQPELTNLENYYTYQFSTDQPYEFYLELSNGDLDEMTQFAKNTLEPRLEELSEVRDVLISGQKEYEVNIELNLKKLTEYGIDPTSVYNLIQNTNSASTLGSFTSDSDEQLLRWDSTLTSVEELEQIKISSVNGMVSLKDISTISVTAINKSATTWKEGDPNIILVQIGRSSGTTQTAMADAVRKEIENIKNEDLVSGFDLIEIVAQSDYVDSSISDVQENILIGGIVAFVILLLFLRNLRATIIIGLSIPSAILLTFLVMWILDYSLDLISLVALGLAIGMIVDASIVVLESIYRKKQLGLTRLDAVIQGTKEVASAVIASMLTTIVVFLPVGVMGGEVGPVIIVLSIVVAIALISSVIVSFTLIPTLSEKFLKVKEKSKSNKNGKLKQSYSNMITWVTTKWWHRVGVILLFFALFVSSILLTSKVPMNMMPDIFNRYTELSIQLESGLAEENTEEIVEEISERLSTIQDIRTHYVLKSGNYLGVIVNMTADEDITRDQKDINLDIMRELRALQDEYPIETVESLTNSGGGGYPVQLSVQGDDFKQLNNIANDLAAELQNIDGVEGITHTLKHQSESKRVVLHQDAIESDGLTSLQIKEAIELLSAKWPLGEMMIDDETLPLNLSLDSSLTTEQDLLKETILTINGESVEMSKYISLETVKTPNQIFHQDGVRNLMIKANIEDRDLGSVNRDVQKMIESFKVPNGYEVSLAGDLEAQQQSMNEMLLVLGIAVFLVYTVMAVQFNSFAHPLVIMSVIPMAFVGAIYGLLISNQELNLVSAIGLLMLIGIIVNNAILLLDKTKQLRMQNYAVKEALIEAGLTRLRPIFMTTLTTAGGMLPLALAQGTAGNFQAPLAIVVISGLIFGTMITLILVPSIYMVFHDIKRLFTKRNRNDQSEEKVAS